MDNKCAFHSWGKIIQGRIIFIILVLFGAFLFGETAKADLGKVDYWNYSPEIDKGQESEVTEKSTSGEYLRGPTRKLRMYGWGPTGGIPTPHAISPIGIEQNKAAL